MRELRINGASNYLAVDGSEFFSMLRECYNFSGAHKGEVQWVEEKNDVFAFVLF